MRPRIVQADGQIGFYWTDPAGTPTTLQALVADDDEAERLVATHLEALDDALIISAERFGRHLGGGRSPESQDERDGLVELHRVLDRLCFEYAATVEFLGLAADLRAGKIIGTAALFSIRAREPLGLLGPVPLDGELDDPTLGVVSGFGRMQQVDPDKPFKGGRWVVQAESGQRFPLTLSMLLFDSSGVNKDAARTEHLDAMRSVMSAAHGPDADALAVACALDWLLYDWLMAHRDGPDSAEIVFPKGHDSAARVIVAAAAASVAARATFDPGLFGLSPR
ncbi:hypothetical protein MMAG44476_14006 [Mycolicibacterium mageritense DSM 44476 = CIP 104973]|uniref:Uncharacterized protein n=1 Tax=Mycolicibacterium mageritense TaxID=53462 RepID=A0AAI8TVK3_MYCME|nr:hypothetical protein [Mycolicibacterium mageritense]MCC9181752.1 hypothetical protein [Mycolicibacterium mageritense]TXI62303.1 MAG: hypothetical protein E6Q55_13195 [Mycolicibacterium mageritense]BDY29347.1 hypothetical protein hbim_03285 [Mycolicibacterium mageritense]CDO21113.1 hypothetical protein BN978_01572 [Mycolicibacterium mageritense DSM 44476 = CIP 104973]